jgi:hypothetical protein
MLSFLSTRLVIATSILLGGWRQQHDRFAKVEVKNIGSASPAKTRLYSETSAPAGRPTVMEPFTEGALKSFVGVRCAMSFTIKVGYDQESEAYFVKSSDIPGLNVASDRADDLIAIVQDVVPNLLGQKGACAELTFVFDTTAAREAKLLH